MKRRISVGFVLVVYFCSSLAFYLPGLAPVSFCEEEGIDDCQVCLNRNGHNYEQS